MHKGYMTQRSACDCQGCESYESGKMNVSSSSLRSSLLKHEQKIMNAGEGMEKREPSYTVGGNVNWYSHYEEQYGGS